MSPNGVAVTPAGEVVITDLRDYKVRKVGTNGVITTMAGTGVQGQSGDGGPATLARLTEPGRWPPTPPATCTSRTISGSGG